MIDKSGTYTTTEISWLTGATKRQVDYWARSGMLASISENRYTSRLFDWRAPRMIKAILHLKVGYGNGVTIRAITDNQLHCRYLLFSGRKEERFRSEPELICASNSVKEVLRAGSSSLCPVVFCDLGL